MVTHREGPAGPDHTVLLLDHDRTHRDLVRHHLGAIPGRGRPGRYPRFRLVVASGGRQALRAAGDRFTAAAVDLALQRPGGLAVVEALRARAPQLAILAFQTSAPGAEASAAVLAGADFFHGCRAEPDLPAFERALELAIDRRHLTRVVERSELELRAARDRLAQLSAEISRSLPGLCPPLVREDLLPFTEAARQYLSAAARLYEGDTRGLAHSLGVSYFALRRLLARYQVPLPSRSRKQGTGAS